MKKHRGSGAFLIHERRKAVFPKAKGFRRLTAPGFYRSCASRRPMGSAHRAGWFRGSVVCRFAAAGKTFKTASGARWKTCKPPWRAMEMQSSRDYSSLSHHRTYRSVYGGSILWAGIYSCLPFLPLPENHTQHSFSYLRQFRYFPTGSQSFDCILLQRMNVPFTVYFDRNRSVLPAFAVL